MVILHSLITAVVLFGVSVATEARADTTAPCERATVAAMTEPAHASDEACVDRAPVEPRSSKLPKAAVDAIERARQFRVAYREPKEPSGETLILLHGSGGNERTLLPLAARAAPHAQLIGIGGRVTQDGTRRWYQRLTPTTFDQTDIRAEADAFVSFLMDQVKRRKVDLERTTFVGYSNGANLLAAVSLLHPGLIQRAVLLRPMPVLEAIPSVDLKRCHFLAIVGETDDVYAPFAPALERMLRGRGARVEVRTVKHNHGLGDEDVKAVGEWLAASSAVSMK